MGARRDGADTSSRFDGIEQAAGYRRGAAAADAAADATAGAVPLVGRARPQYMPPSMGAVEVCPNPLKGARIDMESGQDSRGGFRAKYIPPPPTSHHLRRLDQNSGFQSQPDESPQREQPGAPGRSNVSHASRFYRHGRWGGHENPTDALARHPRTRATRARSGSRDSGKSDQSDQIVQFPPSDNPTSGSPE